MREAQRYKVTKTHRLFCLLISSFCILSFTGCGGHSNPVTDRIGALYIETYPSGAAISLNGAQKGTSPLTLDQLPAGTYKIKASKALSADTEADAVVKGNETSTVTIVLNPESAPGQPTLAGKHTSGGVK